MAPKVQTLNLPLLKGDSPVRGNVSEADKGVPVFGEKDVCGTQTEGLMESEQAFLKGLKQTWLNPSDGFAATSPFRGGKDSRGFVAKLNHNLFILIIH